MFKMSVVQNLFILSVRFGYLAGSREGCAQRHDRYHAVHDLVAYSLLYIEDLTNS